MNPLTLSIIGLYKTAVIRRRGGSWRTHAGHGVDGSTQPVPHARAVVTGGIVGPTPCACAPLRPRARSSRLALADDARSYTPSNWLQSGSPFTRAAFPAAASTRQPNRLRRASQRCSARAAGCRAPGPNLAGQPVSVDQGRQPAKNQQNPISDCKIKTCFVTSLLQSCYNRVTMCYKTLAHS